MTRLICLALLLCGAGIAQERFPLRAIEIVGADDYPKEALIRATGLQLGQPVAQPDFQIALNRLGALGLFDQFEFRYEPQADGYKVTFTVNEIGPLYPVRFAGFDDSPEDLRTFLDGKLPFFADRIPPVGLMPDSITDALQDHWRGQGHDSRVAGQVQEESGELVMLFRPQEHIQTISYVAFEGTELISAFDLQNLFNRVARGVPYSEGRLRELLRGNVQPLYEEKGRMGVKFCPCSAEDDPDSLGLKVTVHVEEGEQYRYGDVPPPEIAGVEPEKIARMYSPRSGQIVNMKKARESEAAIDEALRANGFCTCSLNWTCR